MPPDLMAVTKAIDIDKDIRRESLEPSPVIFQERVERKFDVRVTVVGTTKATAKIFCARVSIKPDTVDWRPYQVEQDIWTIASLPPRTLDHMMRFHEAAALHFATYDFIIASPPSLLSSPSSSSTTSSLCKRPTDKDTNDKDNDSVDDDGEHVFLECNPAGNWMWLENMFPLHYNVTDAIVDMIMG
eukprot:TRINITY_DN9173_c0_g1_i2.p1 TRINITY_DN9173_c0_g1~~TRINITY_DN9173_c0_g1_i2.p1  ORF type:complete len:186 (+),score=47.20 TRINITY_DN9173_c0_g1_i2:770-1327(+)